jgi:hypothetical protein
MKQYIFTKMSQQNQQNQPQKQQQQQPRKKPAAAEWSMDLTSICGDGNGQNALKLKKLEVIELTYYIYK